MLNKQTVTDTVVRGQTVLVRVDYNVPMKDGAIVDDLRIRESLPTIELLQKKGARRIILVSHLGRPEGKKVPELSLEPVYKRLKELLPGGKAFFVPDVSGPDVEEAVESLPVGGVLLLENLRFFPGEEENSADFAKDIVDSTHADLFVQDGFAVVHRAHASTSAITAELPSIAGLLLEKEINGLSKISEAPSRPFVVVIGGAKVDDKQPLIDKFGKIADTIIVGGKIAADGYTSSAKNIYVAEDFVEGYEGELTGKKLDIGPASVEKITEILAGAKTVLWNGLMGMAEVPEFAGGSVAVARAIGTNDKIVSVVCGGDTTGFVENLQKTESELQFSLISTGGGAALEFLSGENLPGIESLEDK